MSQSNLQDNVDRLIKENVITSDRVDRILELVLGLNDAAFRAELHAVQAFESQAKLAEALRTVLEREQRKAQGARDDPGFAARLQQAMTHVREAEATIQRFVHESDAPAGPAGAPE